MLAWRSGDASASRRRGGEYERGDAAAALTKTTMVRQLPAAWHGVAACGGAHA